MSGVMPFTGRHYWPPFDEGVKLVARHLHLQLARLTEVLVATTAPGGPDDIAKEMAREVLRWLYRRA